LNESRTWPRIAELALMTPSRPSKLPSARGAAAPTLRLRLLKIAARVLESAARIRIHLPTARPDAAIFRLLAGRLAAAGP